MSERVTSRYPAYRDRLRPGQGGSVRFVGTGMFCVCVDTYRLTADIRVPDFGDEAHRGRFEWIVDGNLYVDLVGSSSVWRLWRCRDGTLEVREVDAIDGCCINARIVSIGLNVGQLFGYPPITTAGHGKDTDGPISAVNSEALIVKDARVRSCPGDDKYVG